MCWTRLKGSSLFLYYSQGALETARKVVAAGQPKVLEFLEDFVNPMAKNPTKHRKGDDKFMDYHVAYFLLTFCKPQALHNIYDNTKSDTVYSC